MKLLFCFTLSLLILAGCATKKNEPSGIAYDFWLAQKAHNPQKAAKLTIKEDPQRAKLHQKIKIADVTFQDPKISGNKADIPTTLILKEFSPLRNESADVSFITYMQKGEKGWRVNMFETKKALYLALGKSYAQSLGKDFTNTIQQALGDKEEIHAIFRQLIEGIQKAVKTQDKAN